MFATQFGSGYADVDKFHYDSCLVLWGASLTHTIPSTSRSKKYADLIGLILEGFRTKTSPQTGFAPYVTKLQKPSRNEWIANRHPLIDMNLT